LTDTLAVSWQATDADGGTLRSDVMYSKDGTEWLAFVVDTTDVSVTLQTANLPSSSNARIRVSVSDGFNTTKADVGGLQLGPNRPPEAWIVQPPDGAEYWEGANVVLLGSAFDLEDGTLPESSVGWYSSLDGFLAQGHHAEITALSVGTHEIEFRVTDSYAATTSVYATVFIQAVP
jgi:hypothetical protein